MAVNAELQVAFVRHPWVEVFLDDPEKEFVNFLRGYAHIEPYDQAETPDAARMLFGSFATDSSERQVLDHIVKAWLEQRRLEGIPSAEKPSLDSRLSEICDAFRIVSVLSLSETAHDMRARFQLWKSWVDRLVIVSNPDVRAEFLSTLALTQRLVQSKDGVNPCGLEPFWLAICEQSGGQYPKNYLSMGLLGLRLLPEREGKPSERPWMAGLARWAVAQQPDPSDFSRQWWALKALYPRTPAHWREALADTLKQKAVGAISESLREFWMRDVGLNKQKPTDASTAKIRIFKSLGPLSEVESVIAHIAEPLDKIEPQIERIVSNRESYAEVTGDSHFLVTTVCNIGMRLIEHKESIVERGKLAVELARKAIAWQSANAFAWALWRDGLESQGEFGAAEDIGWYTILRFPEDNQWRTQLALLLAKLPGRQTEAEMLLRDAIERFPHDIVPYGQLGELLISLNRVNEANDVVSKAQAIAPPNAVIFDLHARLQFRLRGVSAAQKVLDEALKQFPNDRILQMHRDQLSAGQQISLTSAALRPSITPSSTIGDELAGGDYLSDPVRREGRMHRFKFELTKNVDDSEWRSRAISELQRIMAVDPNLAYANYLKFELIGKVPPDKTVFAVAFIDAIRSRDVEFFNSIDAARSGPTQLFDVARAFLFKDKASADRTIHWLNEPAAAEPRRVAALRGFITRRFGTKVGDNEYQLHLSNRDTFLDLIAANDNIKLDLIDTALVPTEFALAA